MLQYILACADIFLCRACVWSIRWLSGRATYLVDGVRLFEAADAHVPSGPMHADIIVWAPDGNWAEAYDPSLQPSTQAANQHFVALVDSVLVSLLPDPAVTVIESVGPLLLDATDEP